MENIEQEIKDKDFDELQESGCFKNHPFAVTSGYEIFGLARVTEKELQQKPYYKTLSFIKEILNIGFHLENAKNPFVSNGGESMDDGKYYRTLLPKDTTSEQAEILFRNLDKIESFYIKSRIADVLWVTKVLDKNKCFAVSNTAMENYFNFVNYALRNLSGFKYHFKYICDTRHNTDNCNNAVFEET